MENYASEFLANTPEQIEELKAQIATAASAGVVTVKFIKVDGSERVMRCTLADAACSDLAMDRKTSTEQARSRENRPSTLCRYGRSVSGGAALSLAVL